MAEQQPTIEGAVLREQMNGVSRDMAEIKTAMHEVSRALRQLVALEQRQISQQASIEKAEVRLDEQEERIQVVEKDIPSLREMRLWIVGSVGAVLLAFFVAVFSGNVSITLGEKAQAVRNQ